MVKGIAMQYYFFIHNSYEIDTVPQVSSEYTSVSLLHLLQIPHPTSHVADGN